MSRPRTNPLTRQIGERLQQLRLGRAWSQMELARRLHLSQPRLSAIERGQRSLTAEEFLAALKLFNITATDFVSGNRAGGSQLQNALARLGAVHLHESADILPSELVRETGDVIREVLLAAESPRQITALASVLILHADQINFPKLRSQLADAGVGRRLGWLVENTIAAARGELQSVVQHRWRTIYRRGLLVLDEVLISLKAGALRDVRPPDLFDRTVRSQKSLQHLTSAASSVSQYWNIATAIQIDDFADALRASRVAD